MNKRMTYRPVQTTKQTGEEAINVVYYVVGLMILGYFAAMAVRAIV